MRRFFVILACVALSLSLVIAPAFAAEKLAKKQETSYNVGTEPETLDPAKSTGIPEATIELNCFEGLTRLDVNDNPAPAIATSWTVSADNLKYTFKLRRSNWSDGTPLTARDFEWSWKRALAPETASEYANQLTYIKNGEAYNEGKLKDASKVGVKALDDYTLEVVLEAPCPYFLSLCAFPTLMPVNRKVVEKDPDKWFLNPKTYIGNGPFKMQSWQHNSKIELVPNPHYWNKNVVKLTKLTFYLVDDNNTAFSMFETGMVDATGALPLAMIEPLKKAGTLKFSDYIGTYYYMFNVTKPPINDVRVRKALTMAIDRTAIVERVTRAGQRPAYAYVPFGLPDIKPADDFREKGGNFYKEDVAAAKKLLADAGYPDGKGFPTLTILYNTSEAHKQIAEAIQEMWKKNLGINVQLTNQEWGVYLASRDALDYQVARAGWIGDYLDPTTFLDMWVTGNGNNDTGWSNAKYDALIAQAKKGEAPEKRVPVLHEAEKILMDELPIMPIYFYTNPYVEKDYVKGVVRSALGFTDYSEAYIIVP